MAATTVSRIAKRIGRAEPAAVREAPQRFEIADVLARVEVALGRRVA